MEKLRKWNQNWAYRGCERWQERNQDSCEGLWRRMRGKFRCGNGRADEYEHDDCKEMAMGKTEKAEATVADFWCGRWSEPFDPSLCSSVFSFDPLCFRSSSPSPSLSLALSRDCPVWYFCYENSTLDYWRGNLQRCRFISCPQNVMGLWAGSLPTSIL